MLQMQQVQHVQVIILFLLLIAAGQLIIEIIQPWQWVSEAG